MTGLDFQGFGSGIRARDKSNRLAGHELSEVQSGPNPVPNKSTLGHKNIIISLRSRDKAEDEAKTEEDEKIAVGSARSSFSQALKECQDRRLRSGAVSNLNNTVINSVNSSSPSFEVMEKPSAATCPGTPNHLHKNVGILKGWNSELHSNANRRRASTALLPYNNGKALPSKWEDAERWISSPASGDGAVRTCAQQPQRPPKSKSGPLAPPGAAYVQLFTGGNCKLAASSPCSAGVMAVDGSSIQCESCEESQNFVIGTEPLMARSISIHGCPNNSAVSRRDRAAKMSNPESVIRSSPWGHTSITPEQTLPIQHIVELQSMQSPRPEIRDVPVDERVTMTRWSKKNRNKTPGTSSQNANDWKRKAVDIHTASWEVPPKTSMSIPKSQREEAKISAWENLQRAKAEEAIRKLEMKLEKKRSSSMDKIMKKLRSAQKKAQEMRSSTATANHQTARPLGKALLFHRTCQISCFMCRAV